MRELKYPDNFATVSNVIEAQNPLVSIIVPVYNTPAFQLRRCLASLLSQTYRNIEIIIVDDGSDDGDCLAVLDDIESSDSRAKVIQGSHHGVSHARNVALDEALGSWIAFADADDELKLAFIEEALVIAVVYGCDLVCGSVFPLFKGGAKAPQSDSSVVYIVDAEGGDMHALASQMLGPAKCEHFAGPDFLGRGPVAKLYRASLAKSMRFEETIAIGEDTLYNYLIIEKSRRVAIVERVWYWYYQYQDSAVHSPDFGSWVGSIDGILGMCRADEDPIPFLSRCAFMAAQGVSSFVLSDGAFGGRDTSLRLLEYAAEKGCFDPPSFEGFRISPWLKAMVELCQRHHIEVAYWFWAAKTLLAKTVKNNRLIAAGRE